MSWTIVWHPKAAKNLAALPKTLRERIIKSIDRLQDNPFLFLEHLAGQDFYKFRAGDYRALVDLDFGSKIIKVRVFDHRKRVYKRLK